MLSVEQAVRALRREILAGLAGNAPLPGGVSLVAGKVSVSLGLQFQADAGDQSGGLVVATDPARCAHQLTIDFNLQLAAASPGQTTEGSSASSLPAVVEPPHFAELAEIFGAPGFDSSARATVFRETLEDLDEAERREVLTTLGTTAPEGEEPALGRARQLIQRLAGSGPAGPKRGPELLGQLASQAPTAALIRLAAERWRTQSEWAAASVTPE
ncbi:MAG TPA: hypothetical protein VMB21_11165 [Candidatus Limnocylindria bacterium]|jgi:hypothetical protein|nr:hypothetical protein [Candidatus Limnocylindria bacterium]